MLEFETEQASFGGGMTGEALDFIRRITPIVPNIIALIARQSADLITDIHCEAADCLIRMSPVLVVHGKLRGVPFVDEMLLSREIRVGARNTVNQFRNDLERLATRIATRAIKSDYRRKNEQIPGLSYIPSPSSFMDFTA